jgi:hypothetical protein
MLVFYNSIIIMVEILIMYCSQTAEHLIKESGCMLEHAAAAKLRSHVMEGEWVKVSYTKLVHVFTTCTVAMDTLTSI